MAERPPCKRMVACSSRAASNTNEGFMLNYPEDDKQNVFYDIDKLPSQKFGNLLNEDHYKNSDPKIWDEIFRERRDKLKPK